MIAILKHVSLFLFKQLIFNSGKDNNFLTTSSNPYLQAKCKGVFSSGIVLKLISAPFSIKYKAMFEYFL